MSYQTAFNTTDRPVTIPACLLTDGWKDVSYRNDTCPSFANEQLHLIVWVDFDNKEHREIEGYRRINMYTADEYGVATDYIFATDYDEQLEERIKEITAQK